MFMLFDLLHDIRHISISDFLSIYVTYTKTKGVTMNAKIAFVGFMEALSNQSMVATQVLMVLLWFWIGA